MNVNGRALCYLDLKRPTAKLRGSRKQKKRMQNRNTMQEFRNFLNLKITEITIFTVLAMTCKTFEKNTTPLFVSEIRQVCCRSLLNCLSIRILLLYTIYV